MKKEGQLQIPLEKFLFNNDYGLLDSSYEIPSWMIFLFSISEMLEITEYKTRGSAIAQAVIAILAETEEERAAKEAEPFFTWKNYRSIDGSPYYAEYVDDSTIGTALVPYGTFIQNLRNYYSPSSLEARFGLSTQEVKFLQFFMNSVNKKNIDIYIELEDIDEIPQIAADIQNLFTDRTDIKIKNTRILPNGIAALHVAIKGGYVDHDLILALKPPLKNDLRKNTSSRQKASHATLQEHRVSWLVLVDEDDVETIAKQDRLPFLDVELPQPELLLQTARALRFNTVLPPIDTQPIKSINESDLNILIQQLQSHVPKSEYSIEEKYIIAQATNEFMVAFLHSPELIISIILQLPDHIFPHLNRNLLRNNSSEIIKNLSQQPRHYFDTDKEKHIKLNEVASLLTSNSRNEFQESEIYQQYSQTVNSIDEKMNMKEKIGEKETHTSWYFDNYLDYFYFQLLFCPLDIPILQ